MKVAIPIPAVLVMALQSETASLTTSWFFAGLSQIILPVFHSRVGKVILDGVEDPVTHASVLCHPIWGHRVESIDEAFESQES